MLPVLRLHSVSAVTPQSAVKADVQQVYYNDSYRVRHYVPKTNPYHNAYHHPYHHPYHYDHYNDSYRVRHYVPKTNPYHHNY